MRHPPLEDRFWSKVDKGAAGDCWNWKAGLASGGYGSFLLGGVNKRAHRISYTMLVGPILDGLVLDHLCRNRICVNPSHLEPVTLVENIKRGIAGQYHRALKLSQTQCKHGHEYTPDNLSKHKRNWRRCRECNRLESVRYHARKLAGGKS